MKQASHASPTNADLDTILAAQIAVAWAGEGGEEPRLGWWKSDLVSEFGGVDLFQQLLPHTWRWAVVQSVREVARRFDRVRRAQHHDPDQIVSLYHLGFELDERLDERLQDLKRQGAAPEAALPALEEIISATWSQQAFDSWLGSHPKPDVVTEPTGRRVRGAPPDDLSALARDLLGALRPLGDAYPLPHFRRA